MSRSKTVFSFKKYFRRSLLVAAFSLVFIPSAYLVPKLFTLNYYSDLTSENTSGASSLDNNNPAIPEVVHLPTPSPLKAVYMTSCVAATPSLRENLVTLINETELNSVMIDIKDFSGGISFEPETPQLKEFVSDRCIVSDLPEFIKTLHDKGIYVIGRITVFQDPVLSKRRPDLAVQKASNGSVWKDFKGLSFTDPSSKEVWDHHILISEEAYGIGFDELNYDYIRFPSDGPMKDIAFPVSGNREKSEVMEDFFEYLNNSMEDTGAVLSADLFGMTTTNKDDLNIGQIWEKALPYFDYIAPMVYPSHYPAYFNGWPNPNLVPYEIIKFSLDEAVVRTLASTTPIKTKNGVALSTTTPPIYSKEIFSVKKIRPWIQDFDYGGDYGPAEVRAQIQATYDAGLDSWMLWDPANRYTKEALKPFYKDE
jgi:hypothetical protein